MNLKINTINELNKKSILIEYDAGYINPTESRNVEIIRESNGMLDHSKPIEFYAVLQKYNTPNRNGRTYPERILKREAENYKKMMNIKCPYCSVLSLSKDIKTIQKVCKAIYKSGQNKGKVCGRINCKIHKKKVILKTTEFFVRTTNKS